MNVVQQNMRASKGATQSANASVFGDGKLSIARLCVRESGDLNTNGEGRQT